MDFKGAWVIGGRNYLVKGKNCVGCVSDHNEDTVEVVWVDGQVDAFTNGNELYLYDLGPTGIQHDRITCGECYQSPIIGMRWKCDDCHDFDLCSSCYHENKHNARHKFNRIVAPGYPAVQCNARKNAVKVYGFFAGAKVRRGNDWMWEDQDGGEESYGKVVSTYEWSGESSKSFLRSGTSVLWDKTQNTNNYRTGFEGKMDLTCIEPAVGGKCFKESLPTIGYALKNYPGTFDKKFSVGDLVTVYKTPSILMKLQNDHGGFVPDMTKIIGLPGRVIDNSTNLVFVAFDNNPSRVTSAAGILGLLLGGRGEKMKFAFNSMSLKKIEKLDRGDNVKVINDKLQLKLVQQNIKYYQENIESLYGEKGEVVQPFNGKVTLVKFAGDVVVPLSSAVFDKHEQGVGKLLASLLLLKLLGGNDDDDDNEDGDKTNSVQIQEILGKDIVSLSIAGDTNGVRKILNENPGMINALKRGKSPLHIALIKGNQDLIKLLIDRGADVTMKDDDNDNPLHIASLSNLHHFGRQFIQKGCPKDSCNSKGFTALHLAVIKEHELFVQMLIEEGCDPNIKDKLGNSSFFIACDNDNTTIAELILSSPKFDVRLTNSNDFAPMHFAALKGKQEVVKALLNKFPLAINSQKEDGYTPLHIAVVNGRDKVVQDMLSCGEVMIEMRTEGGKTAIHLACIEGYLSVVKLLLQFGANINAEVSDGDTALHICIIKHLLLSGLPQLLGGESELCPSAENIQSKFNDRQTSAIVIACYLVSCGSTLTYINHQGQTPLDVCKDEQFKALLKEFDRKTNQVPPSSFLLHAQGQTPLDVPQGENFRNLLKEFERKTNQVPPSRPSVKPKPVVKPKPSVKPKPIRPSQQLREEETNKSCQMCDKNADGKFMPCGHVLCCVEHAECMSKCPECKGAVTEVVDIKKKILINCVVCRDVPIGITFKPCGHQIACYDCGMKFKVCLICDQKITSKEPIGDAHLRRAGAASRVEESDTLCNICYERRRNAVFLCGHGACKKCAYVLRNCHMCRVNIERIIEIFE